MIPKGDRSWDVPHEMEIPASDQNSKILDQKNVT
jgi:hypothetical protein